MTFERRTATESLCRDWTTLVPNKSRNVVQTTLEYKSYANVNGYWGANVFVGLGLSKEKESFRLHFIWHICILISTALFFSNAYAEKFTYWNPETELEHWKRFENEPKALGLKPVVVKNRYFVSESFSKFRFRVWFRIVFDSKAF